MSVRDEVLAANAPKSEPLFIPEWNRTVLIREMQCDQRDKFDLDSVSEKDSNPDKKLQRIRARLVCAVTCEENGDRIFTDADVDEIGRGSSVVADRIYDVGARLNRLKAKDVEELVKNS